VSQPIFALEEEDDDTSSFAEDVPFFPIDEDDKSSSSEIGFKVSSSEEMVSEHAVKPQKIAVVIPSFQNVDLFIFPPMEKFIYLKYNSLAKKGARKFIFLCFLSFLMTLL
jgi:hypothetical protein